MSEFFDWFRNKYGTDFPIALPRRLEPFDQGIWISAELSGRVTEPPMVPEFYEEPAEYALAGEWGRGVNSYAFYFVEKRAAHRRFFRLFSGGAYGRPDDDRRLVVEYLAGYERWRLEREAAFSASTLVCNMGQSSAELVRASGGILEHKAFLEGAAWWEELKQRT